MLQGLARWTARIICTAFFLIMQPLYVGYGRPNWERLTWLETFFLLDLAFLLVCCIMAWIWPRLAGWLMLLALSGFYGVMVCHSGELHAWLIGALFLPAVLLVWAGKQRPLEP